MSDFNLSRESCELVGDYNVAISEFENKTEQRRLITPDRILGWKIKTPQLTKTQMNVYDAFFISKKGPLTAFTFTCPFTSAEYTVRFKPGSYKFVFESGTFQGDFEFERVF
jgi:hypothetical protein